MKFIKVNSSCIGCGLCCLNNEYLEENIDGNAVPVSAKSIKNEDIKYIEHCIKNCPVNALYIKEAATITKRFGKDGLEDIISYLKKEIEKFEIKKINKAEIKFDINDYELPIPQSQKQNIFFNTKFRAEDSAKYEIEHYFFSEDSYRPLLRKIFVEYNIRKLKYFYNLEDENNNIFYYYNQQVRNLLAEVYAEINNMFSENNLLEKSWLKFSYYMENENENWALFRLKDFEVNSLSSGIISDFKTRKNVYSYYSLINIDRVDFIKKWYFENFDKAAENYIIDLKQSINRKADYIESLALDDINYVLERFEIGIKESLKHKVHSLEKIFNKLGAL